MAASGDVLDGRQTDVMSDNQKMSGRQMGCHTDSNVVRQTERWVRQTVMLSGRQMGCHTDSIVVRQTDGMSDR